MTIDKSASHTLADRAAERERRIPVADDRQRDAKQEQQPQELRGNTAHNTVRLRQTVAVDVELDVFGINNASGLEVNNDLFPEVLKAVIANSRLAVDNFGSKLD